jgi:hypothetical protein
MAVYKTWNLLTADNKPYTAGITDKGATFLAWGSTVVAIDPQTLGSAIGQILDALAQLAAVVCPATLVAGTDTLTCDWKPDHDKSFHHDPRGFFWGAA